MARQRYYGEKFKPTKGHFKQKQVPKKLERQELRKQIAEFKAKQAENAKKADEAKKTETAKSSKTQSKSRTSKENATTKLSKDQSSAFNDITDWYVYHQNSVPFLTMGGYAGIKETTLMSLLKIN